MAPSTFERGLRKRAGELLHPTQKVAISGTAADLDALNRVISPATQRLPGSVAAVAQLAMELQAIADQSLSNGRADEDTLALTESTSPSE